MKLANPSLLLKCLITFLDNAKRDELLVAGVSIFEEAKVKKKLQHKISENRNWKFANLPAVIANF